MANEHGTTPFNPGLQWSPYY